MSFGYKKINQLRNFEEQIAKVGLNITRPKYSYEHDYLSLSPNQDAFPDYSRDHSVFTGTLEEAERWLQGFMFARNYYTMIGLLSDSKIAKKEQAVRNRQLLRKIKNPNE